MHKAKAGPWTHADAAELYLVNRWGAPYFTVNERGHMVFCPPGQKGPGLDLKELVDELCQRGIQAPLLLRFNDILRHAIAELNGCFEHSIKSYGYNGTYRGVVPIKVNQQRHVIEELVRLGEPFALGLEAGSKPELLAAIALLEGHGDGLLVCNGYKDSEYVETALYAQWLGLSPVIVLDRFAELDLTLAAAKRTGIRPRLGARVKLSTRGSGRWQASGGDRSKFGLSARELMAVVDMLRERDMLDCLRLLHFHIGSQITNIKNVKQALNEASQLYINLRKLGCDHLDMVDCGGGLAIDYDGSRTNDPSSKNYSIQEYANDIVATLQEACDHHQLPHPTIITESGRALMAQHSVLLFNVLGVHSLTHVASPSKKKSSHAGTGAHGHEDIAHHHTGELPADAHEVVRRLAEVCEGINSRNFQEAYNDIVEHKEACATLFSHGVIDLKTRCRAEELFWTAARRIQKETERAEYVPGDLRHLSQELSDTYFCNFSVFQSLPDAWAIGQLFPIAPIHRLDERPEREAILADLTCDSDGKLDRFIDLHEPRHTLPLHAPNGKPYYLGAFLVGAYQEILGDLHNLFGDTNAVHVSLQPDGGYTLDHLVEGDSVTDVLSYVEFDRAELIRRVRRAAERALKAGRFRPEHFAQFMRRYEEGLGGYTYLEDID